MDYRDLEAGTSPNSFWFRSKRNLIQVLMQKTKHKNAKILNLGAGTGEDLSVLNQFGDCFIVDIEEKALELIPKTLYKEKKVADATKLPYRNGFFDIVVCFDVLEHLSNDKKAVKEIFRVLKKGGNFVFTVPAFQFLFSTHDKALGHQRRYNMITINTMLKNFYSIKTGYWNTFLFFPVALMRLFKKGSDAKVDKMEPPWLIDSFFYVLLKFENFIIKKGFRLPFGITIWGVCKK